MTKLAIADALLFALGSEGFAAQRMALGGVCVVADVGYERNIDSHIAAPRATRRETADVACSRD